MAKRKEIKQTGEEKKRKIKRNRNIALKQSIMKRKRCIQKKLKMKLIQPQDGSMDYLEFGKEVYVVDLKDHNSTNRGHSRQLMFEEFSDEETNSTHPRTADVCLAYDQQISPLTSISGHKKPSDTSLEFSGIENLEETSKHLNKDECQTSFSEDSFVSSSPQISDFHSKGQKRKDVKTESMSLSERVLVVDVMQTSANLCKEHFGGEGFQRIYNFSGNKDDDEPITSSNKIRKSSRTSKKSKKNNEIGLLSSSSISQTSTPSGQLEESFSRIDLPEVSIVDVNEDFMYDNEEGSQEKDQSEIQEGDSNDSEDDEEGENILEIYQRIESDDKSKKEGNDFDSDISEYFVSSDEDSNKSFDKAVENSPLPFNEELTDTNNDLEGQVTDCGNGDQVISDVDSPLLKVPGSISNINTSLEEASLNKASKQNGARTQKKQPKARKTKNDKTSFSLFRHVESGKAVLIFRKNGEVPFVGRVYLHPLLGCVTVNGFNVKANQGWYPVYATATTNIPTLSVKVLQDDSQQYQGAEISRIEKLISEEDKAKFAAIAGNGPFAALLLQRLDCNAWSFAKQLNLLENDEDFTIEYEIPIGSQCHQIFHELGFFLYPLKCSSVSQLKPIKILPGQENAIHRILGSYKESKEVPVIAVCGHQGAGKSTLTRYIVNSFLNETDGICYIDADTGQSELTPSCLVSLHYLTEPLLGIPFVHQRQPVKMYFYGSNETKKSPDLYLEMLTSLHQYYSKTFPSKPLVINTNGWVTGLGAFLLTDILHIMMPTHVVLLNDKSQKTSLDFFSKRSWLQNEEERNHLPFSILNVQAAPKTLLGSKVLRRNLTLVGYLSALYKPSPTSGKFKLSSVTPYVVPWRSVAVHVCNHTISPNHILYAFNASVVGLCAVDTSKMYEVEGAVPSDGLPKILKETPMSECLGLGIVRGIDPVTKVFYIITPVPAEELSRVTALIKGTHALPHDLLKEDFYMDSLPYVATSLNRVSVSQPYVTTKRLSRRPAAVLKNLKKIITKKT